MEIVGRDGVDLSLTGRMIQGVSRRNRSNVPELFYNVWSQYQHRGEWQHHIFSECEMRYILGCIAVLLTGQHKTMEPRQAVHDAYNERIDAANLTMAWGSENVNSWYKNASGRVTQNWPYSLWKFWEQSKSLTQ